MSLKVVEAEVPTLDGVPVDFLVRLCEAVLSETVDLGKTMHLQEREFGGVFLKLMVTSHWAGFERFMLVGRDWQCGLNLSPCRTELDSLFSMSVFGAHLCVSNPGVAGSMGFARDMTVLRMTYSDWRLPHYAE